MVKKMTEEEFNKLLAYLLEEYKTGKDDIPKRVIDNSIKTILKTFGDRYNSIFMELLTDLSSLGSAPSLKEQNKLITKLENQLLALNKAISSEVQNEVVKSYVNGQVAQTINYLDKKDFSELKSAVSYSILNTPMISNLVADTMEDLLFVTQHTNKEVKKVIRDTFKKKFQLLALGENQDNVKKIIEKELTVKAIKKNLLDNGFIGIYDSKGRRWGLKTYVDMAVRTKCHQAYVSGAKDRSVNYSDDIARIPNRPTQDTCKMFTGMLISLTGRTKGFMTYDQLKATGLIFHPNCKHSPIPVGKLDMLHKDDIKEHNEKVNSLSSGLADWKKEHPNNKMGKGATAIQKANKKDKPKQTDLFKNIDKDIKEKEQAKKKHNKKHNVIEGQTSMF